MPLYYIGGTVINVPVVSTGGTTSKTGTTTTKKKRRGQAVATQNNTDPYSLIAAKTTAGHKAVWDGALGHYKYS